MKGLAIFTKQKSDILGALASTLCLIHCVATPFVFMITASFITSNNPLYWWKFMDYLFLIISFLAIYRSTETSTSIWIKYALWISWALLSLIVLNEKMEWLIVNELIIYIPTVLLIGLHLINRKYCKCKVDKCCAN
ncbi:hypothetical protein AXE80_07755 [Wenyingzhuangia fucanilytica]|uniref:MerC mercury resistance protein n=1 Tax=Wenyingzhuangia fucanilytica TaxID=1790137 RepID=A0A1B1Y602_9FLAO|nr:MerC domain-containing protein [Wenyingzhuangia fucanilytica]ANW96177.1 hypothetical protein AXE80_07755 [Wenyingzhuangia fucanilytica]